MSFKTVVRFIQYLSLLLVLRSYNYINTNEIPCENNMLSSLRSLVKYFSTLEEKFRISVQPCNVLYLLPLAMENKLQL